MRLSLMVLVSFFALTACGGGGSDDSSTTQPPSSQAPPDEKISGIWTGSTTGQQSGVTNEISCLVTQSEELACLLVDPSTGELAGGIQGTVSVANVNHVSGSGTVHAAANFVLSDGSTFSDFTITSGTVAERTSLDLVVDAAGESTVVNLTFDPLYDRGSSLDAVEGVYTGFTVDGVAASFSIDANGEIFAQSGTGCIGSGQISVGASQFNEYNVEMDISNCLGLNASYSGLAISTDFASTDDELDFAIFSGQLAIFGAVIE